MIDPKIFLGYQTRVLPFNFMFFAMSNTPPIAEVENDLIHGILHNTPIRVLISLQVFGRLMQYLINCQNIYG